MRGAQSARDIAYSAGEPVVRPGRHPLPDDVDGMMSELVQAFVRVSHASQDRAIPCNRSGVHGGF